MAMKLHISLCLLSATLFLTVEGVCKTTLTAFEQAVLDKHNELRRLHEDTPDLCYGESGSDISFSSQTWANELSSSTSFGHSTSSSYYDSSNPYGENLASAGTTGTVAAEDAAYEKSTQAWYDEISDWDFSTSASTGGVTGHFTQVVWKNSAQLNCGYATFVRTVQGNTFNSYNVVCQYYPAGNYQNQYSNNVKPLSDTNDTEDNNNNDDSSGDNSNNSTNNNTDNNSNNNNNNSNDTGASASTGPSIALVIGLLSAATMHLIFA